MVAVEDRVRGKAEPRMSARADRALALSTITVALVTIVFLTVHLTAWRVRHGERSCAVYSARAK